MHWLLAFVLVLATSTPAIGQPCDASPLLITNVNVWSADGVLERRDVLLRDGRIASVAPSREQRDYTGRRLDGAGHTLLPGLIDAHLHFVLPGGLPQGTTDREEADIAGRQLLRSGVTAGRVHLDSLENARALKTRSVNDCEPLPRVQVGGPGLGGAAQKDGSVFWGVTTVAEATAKVDKIAAAGIDWVALHDAEKFQPDVFQTIVAAARKAGLRLMGAGTRSEEIAAVLRARPDTLDYLVNVEQDVFAPKILDEIRRQSGLVLVPTLGIHHRVGAYVERPELLERAGNVEFLQPDQRAHVLAAARDVLAGKKGPPRALGSLPRKLQQLRELGLPLAAGADGGSQLHFQTDSIWWELEAWRTFGASHREALRAATEGAARVLRASDVGRIAAGHRADFVLYRGDVQTGPFDGSRVMAVGKGGVLYVVDGKWTGR